MSIQTPLFAGKNMDIKVNLCNASGVVPIYNHSGKLAKHVKIMTGISLHLQPEKFLLNFLLDHLNMIGLELQLNYRRQCTGGLQTLYQYKIRVPPMGFLCDGATGLFYVINITIKQLWPFGPLLQNISLKKFYPLIGFLLFFFWI